MPMPEAAKLAELNGKLLAMRLKNRDRILSRQSQPIGKASEYERAFLTPLAEEGYPIE